MNSSMEEGALRTIDYIRSCFNSTEPLARITVQDVQEAGREDLEREVIIQQDRAEQAITRAKAAEAKAAEVLNRNKALKAAVDGVKHDMDTAAHVLEKAQVEILKAEAGGTYWHDGYARVMPKPPSNSEIDHVGESGEYPVGTVDRGRTEEQLDEVVRQHMSEPIQGLD